MKEILENILKDVDPDIRELMLKEEEPRGENSVTVSSSAYVPMRYKNWELLPDAAMTALYWQLLRDNKK